MEELFNRPILDQLYDSISDDFETMLLKKKNSDGKFTESLKVEEELINLIKKVVKDEKKLDPIIAKLNKFELAIGNETDLLCKHYYKLGIVDSKKILMEIGDKVIELFCMADDFCKFFDRMVAKYTFMLMMN